MSEVQAILTESLKNLTPVSLILSILSAGFVIILIQYLKTSWKYRHIPGPLPLPLVGHLYLPNAPQVMRFLSKMRKDYGKIHSFWPGNTAMVVVCDAKSARQILTDTRTFIKGSDYSTKFALVFGQGLVTSNGEKHRKDRSCLAKYFVRNSVENYLGFMNKTTNEMIKDTLQVLPQGTELDLQEFFHMLALRVFGYFAAGHDYSKDPEAPWINHAVSKGSSVVGEHIVLGLPVWSWIPRIVQLKSDVKKMHEHIDKLVANRMKLREEGKPENDDCLKGMLDEQMPRHEMHEHFTTLLSAGHDTTAFFGCYMAYMLATNPHVQDKLKKEVKEVLGDRTEVTSEDIKKLEYCSNVMKETLRLYTVIPFVNRTTSDDVKLRDADIELPKDTTCLIPLCLLNRDPDVWENPNDFNPDRFNDLKIGDNSAKHGFLPFGYGTRTCIGNTLALVEGTVMFALLAQKVTFEPIPGWKPTITAGISLTASRGIRCKIRTNDL